MPWAAIYRTLGATVSGVRGRLTILATAMLAVALALAAAIMLFVLYQSLLGSADVATSARVQELAATIDSEGVGGVDAAVLVPTDDLDVIQVIDSSGHLVAANPAGPRSPLVSPLAAGERRTIDGARFPGIDAEYRLTAQGVQTTGGPVTVAAGAAEQPIRDVLATVAIVLCVLFPLILATLIIFTYYFVGRTLRPVERIRAQVAAITSGDLSARVPVPTTNDEISTLATTMNDMLGGLEQARLQQLRFVGDASHELRSPLMTLVGLLDLSRTTHEPIDPDTVETILLPEAQRLETMVDDLLLLARSDEHGVALRYDDVDLDEIVSAQAARLEALTSLDIHVTLTPIRVRGDTDKLSRAVRNLADNAARHARQTVTFALAADEDTSLGQLSIIDDGPGIPDCDKVRVLDRFVRLDNNRKRSSGGSGLGLAIVDEIVRAHHGSIAITDTPGGGTTVKLSLPLDDS